MNNEQRVRELAYQIRERAGRPAGATEPDRAKREPTRRTGKRSESGTSSGLSAE